MNQVQHIHARYCKSIKILQLFALNDVPLFVDNFLHLLLCLCTQPNDSCSWKLMETPAFLPSQYCARAGCQDNGIVLYYPSSCQSLQQSKVRHDVEHRTGVHPMLRYTFQSRCASGKDLDNLNTQR